MDTTEWLHFHFSLSCIGEGNGNPFQCSCLENPRDGRAWWAAVYGVAQSQTWLKPLSSSSLFNNWFWENWISTDKRYWTFIPHKNQLNMEYRLKCKTWNYKTPRKRHIGKVSWHWNYAMLYKYNIKSTGNKNENRQVGLHQTEKSSLHPELPTERQCME